MFEITCFYRRENPAKSTNCSKLFHKFPPLFVSFELCVRTLREFSCLVEGCFRRTVRVSPTVRMLFCALWEQYSLRDIIDSSATAPFFRYATRSRWQIHALTVNMPLFFILVTSCTSAPTHTHTQTHSRTSVSRRREGVHDSSQRCGRVRTARSVNACAQE